MIGPPILSRRGSIMRAGFETSSTVPARLKGKTPGYSVGMKMTDLFIAQLDAEAPRTRRTLERVPEGRDDWKPHEKSMAFGRLAMLVARMPSWISLILDRDDLD